MVGPRNNSRGQNRTMIKTLMIKLMIQLYDCVPHADNNRIRPCRVQQRRRSRAQQEQQEIQGPPTLIMRSDHGSTLQPAPTPPPGQVTDAGCH